MEKRIVIDPVTRIEGHAKISIFVDEAGRVVRAQFHVVEFRGFEKFCEGRPFAEMPGITARICGICPVSHLLASAKAGDAIMAVDIPPAAEKLRRLMNLGQFIQSHALSFFHLSAPDLVLGWDAPPAARNVFGLIAANPDLARSGIRLRSFGQQIIEKLGGKRVHPAWAVPGGVRSPLTQEDVLSIRVGLPEAFDTVRAGLELFRKLLPSTAVEAQVFGNFPSLFLGLVGPDGQWEHHGGKLRIVDGDGHLVADQLEPANYADYLDESVQEASYLKAPFYRPYGLSRGMYRVGPLARLNVCSRMGVPRADAELKAFRALGKGGIVTSSFLYHYARLIEILAALEIVERALDDSDLLSRDLRADAGINRLRGVGVTEAPRGTLFHDYEVDRGGLLTKVNLIVATGHNSLAMNRTVEQIARHFLKGPDIPEPMLNRIEHGIRCFDPCLSCATHAAGQMPLKVRLVGPDGRVIREAVRG